MKAVVKDPVFFVCGATGTGKSSLAIRLAVLLKSSYGYKEVVIANCDVMQFYKDLPIATNKGSKAEAQGIPHVFMGFLNADDTYSAEPEADYYGDQGFADGEGPTVRSKLPHAGEPFTIHTYVDRVVQWIDCFFKSSSSGAVIVCGGTCYYLQSVLLQNTLVAEDDDDRGKPNEEQKVGSAPSEKSVESLTERDLWKKLNEVDPIAAQRYHPNDTRRVRRLLEIYSEKGTAPSAIFESHQAKLRFSPEQTFFVWTWTDREALNERLRVRVDEMVGHGLLSEVKDFRRKTRAMGRIGAVGEAIGFKEFAEVSDVTLDAQGDSRTTDAVERVKRNTIQYARKQERWFSNRIQTLLLSLDPRLPHNHCVCICLGTTTDKNAEVKELADVLLAGSLAQSTSISFPLMSAAPAKAPVTQEYCELCQAVIYGRGQMETHAASKRHCGALKRQRLEREQLEKYGRILPPRKLGGKS